MRLRTPSDLRGWLALLKRWATPALAAGMALLALTMLWNHLRRDVWAHYEGAGGGSFRADDPRARAVLWQDPERQQLGRDDAATERVDAAFSADGTAMVLARAGDLFVSRWDGRRWSKPAPLDPVNSTATERGPALSRDGNHLYFASDRPGGLGGFDLYSARWDGRGWGGIEPLPAGVNSTADETGPSLSPDGASLYFTSDRDGAGGDIFVSEVRAGPAGRGGVAPSPRFAAAVPVDALNSKAADVEAAMTARGDHVFLASDRGGARGDGFRVYLSRVIDGEPSAPEEVDLYFDEGDVTDPAVRMEGFDLLFSARGAGGAEDGEGYALYRSTTREVIAYTDTARWSQFTTLLGDIAWWILLAAAALIALIYILEKWRDMTSLFHKCLAGSAVVHLLALLLAMLWLIAREVELTEAPPPEEVAVALDALAQEELALESVPEASAISDVQPDVASEKVESEFGAPGFESADAPAAMPERAETARESAVAEAQPVREAPVDPAAPAPAAPASLLADLAATALPEIDAPVMEESEFNEPVEQLDPDEATFEPATPALAEAVKAETDTARDAAMATPAEAAEVSAAAPAEPLAEQARESMVEAAAPEADASEATPLPAAQPSLLASLPEMNFDPAEAPAMEQLEAPPGAAAEAREEVAFDPAAAGAAVASTQADTVGDAPGDAPGDAAASEAAEAGEVGGGAERVGESALAGAAVAAPAEAAAGSGAAAAPAGAIAADLPDLAMGDVVGGAPMEERPADAAPGGAPAEGDRFEPAAAGLAVAKADAAAVADTASSDAAETSAIAAAARVAASAAPTLESRPPEAASAGVPGTLPPAPAPPDALPGAVLPALDAPAMEERGGGAPAPRAR